MEAEAAHAEPLAPVARHRVRVRLGRQREMERGVEHGHLRHVGEDLAGEPDPGQVDRVVQGCEWRQLFDGGDDVVVDEGRPGEAVAAVHDPVPDRDRGQVGSCCRERLHHRVQRLAVAGEGTVADVRGIVPVAVREPSPLLPDAFDQALGRTGAGDRVHELVLDG